MVDNITILASIPGNSLYGPNNNLLVITVVDIKMPNNTPINGKYTSIFPFVLMSDFTGNTVLNAKASLIKFILLIIFLYINLFIFIRRFIYSNVDMEDIILMATFRIGNANMAPVPSPNFILRLTIGIKFICDSAKL